MEGRQVSRSGQSLMTSVSGPESQIDLNITETHRLVIINQHTTSHQNRRRLCKFLIDLTWNTSLVLGPLLFFERLPVPVYDYAK